MKTHETMRVRILGTRGEIDSRTPLHTKHSGVLIDHSLLFDVGEQVFLKHQPRAIFITHLHPDHAFFVRAHTRTPIFTMPVYAPEKWPGVTIKVQQRRLVVGPYVITPIPTEHSLKVLSQAYLIEKDGIRVLYTGDLFWIKKEHRKQLKNLSLVITEASHLKKGGLIRRQAGSKRAYGHAGIPDLLHLFKPYTNHVVLMHFGSWFYAAGARKARRQIQACARECGMRVDVGYDDMCMILTK